MENDYIEEEIPPVERPLDKNGCVDNDVYRQMADKKMGVACAQLSVLDLYDSANRKKRQDRLYKMLYAAFLRNPSEHSLDNLDAYIAHLQKQIERARQEKPAVEESETARQRLNQLEKILRSNNLL